MKSNLPEKRAFFALLTATAIWGAAGPVIKLTLEYIPPFTFLFLRFLIVGVVLLPYIILELRKSPIDKRDLPNLFILGLLGQTSLILIFIGLKFTTALDASLIGVIYPILAIAAGHYFYKEKVNKKERLGVIIASLGTLIIVLEPAITNPQISRDVGLRILGNFLIFSYQFIWLTYIIWSKRVMGQRSKSVTKATKFLRLKPMHKEYSPTVLMSITFYVGLATFIPTALLEATGVFGYKVVLANLTLTPILGILYMALLSSIVAYIAFQWGIHKAQISDAALFTYLGPIFAFPAAFILLGEIPTKAIIYGGAVIILGVLIAERNKS